MLDEACERVRRKFGILCTPVPMSRTLTRMRYTQKHTRHVHKERDALWWLFHARMMRRTKRLIQALHGGKWMRPGSVTSASCATLDIRQRTHASLPSRAARINFETGLSACKQLATSTMLG